MPIAESNPQVVLRTIEEIREQVSWVSHWSQAHDDFTFEWNARNGGAANTDEDKLRFTAEFLASFSKELDGGYEQATAQMEAEFRKWALERGIDPEQATKEDIGRFDKETGATNKLLIAGDVLQVANLIAAGLSGLADSALAMGCDTQTVAAVRSASELLPDVTAGRLPLGRPSTFTEAHHAAHQIFQDAAIGGVPLDDAWRVALDRLELAAQSKVAAAESLTAPASPVPSEPADGPKPPNEFWYRGKRAVLEPTPWRLLNYLWQNPHVSDVHLVEAVWQDKSASEVAMSDALKSAIRRANRGLGQVAYPRHIGTKSGYVSLS